MFLVLQIMSTFAALGPGSALRFDGGSEWVQILGGPIPVGTGLTLECWMRPLTSVPAGNMLRAGRGVSFLQLAFDGPAKLLYFGISTSSGYRTLYVPIVPSDFTDGLWHHVAATYDGNIMKLYRDGLMLGSTNVAANLTMGGPDVFGLWLQPDGTYRDGFRGELDEVRVWRIARSAIEINQTMNRPLVGNEPGLEAYWRLDEGSAGIVHDSSGHGHDGQLFNFYVGPADGNGWIVSRAFLGQPLAVTLSPSLVTTNSAVLKGMVNPYGSPTLAWFDWSPTVPAQDMGNGSTSVPVSYTLNNLAPTRYYIYRCIATNDSGPYYGEYVRFLTLGPPVPATLEASVLTPVGGQLNATVIPNGFDTMAWFEYGLTTNHGLQTPAVSLGTTTASIGVSNIVSEFLPLTTVHYRVVATNSQGTNYGADIVLNTLGPAGTSLLFDGVNDSVSLPVIDLTKTNRLTLEAWIRLAGGPWRPMHIINMRKQGVPTPIWAVTINSPELSFWLSTSEWHAVLRSPININDFLDGGFHHVAATYDGSLMKLYQDGRLLGSTSLNGNIGVGATDHSIAWGGGEDHFSGQIDEVRIWSATRTQTQIDQTRFQRLTGTEPGLVGYWRFDDADGLIADDSSGNGRAGTLVGPPRWVFSAIPLGKPFVKTTAADLVSSSNAVLNAIINPDGFDTGAWFQWGTDTSYGNSIVLQTLAAGTQTVPISQSVTNLLPDTTYYFRAVAQNTNGTILGQDQTFVLGSKDKALRFDGLNDYVHLAPISLIDTQFTLEAWVKPFDISTSQYHEILRQQFISRSMYDRPPDWLLSFQDFGSVLSFGLFTSYYHELHAPITATDFTDGSWHHIAATYDGSTKRIYHNGVEIGSAGQTGVVTATGTGIAIGSKAWGTDEFFNGVIDEVRIWRVARTPNELIQNMNRPLGGAEPNLVAYLRLNEGTGDATADSTGNGNNGSLFNSPTWVVSDALLRPICVMLPVTNLSNSSAVLNGVADPEGVDLIVWFEFGNTTNYGSRTSPLAAGNGLADVSVVQNISGLLAGTDYYCRCVGSNASGLLFSPGVNFRTLGARVITLPPSMLSDTSMILNGLIDPHGLPTKFWFEWGTNSQYGLVTPQQDYAYEASSIVTNLLVGQTYHCRVMATNSGGLATGQDQVFTPSFVNVATNCCSGQISSGSVAWGDYDGDLDLDLLVSGSPGTNAYAVLYRNDITNFFCLPGSDGSCRESAGLEGVGNGASLWGDFDNDGALDVLLTGGAYYYWVPICQVFHNENGHFRELGLTLPGLIRSTAATGDYDNDGFLDFVAAGSTNGYLSADALTNLLCHNNGDGTFSVVQSSLPGVFDGSLAWGDYDNDGQLDLAIIGNTGNSNISRIYRNDHGVFKDIGANLPGVCCGSVAWGDYDNDGQLDLLLLGQTNSDINSVICRIYHNQNGTFTDIGAPLMGVSNGSAAWGDFDGDGYLDVVILGHDNSFPIFQYQIGSDTARIYRNDHGLFSDIGAGLRGVTRSAVAWGDFDNDGRLDLAAIGYWGSLQIYRNFLSPATNNANSGSAPPNLASAVRNNGARLTWSQATDPHTPASGLTYNVRVGTTPGGGQLLSPQSDALTGRRQLPQMGNAQHRLFTTLTNLPIRNYYWSAQSVNNSFAGSPWAPEQQFAITSGPPIAITLAASNVLCCSALLAGSVTAGGLPTRTWFDWGGSTNFGQTSTPMDIGSGLVPQSQQYALTNLQPLTTYYFRVVATNDAGLVIGTNQVFTTAGPAPVVATLGTTNVGYTVATLLGESSLSAPQADCFIEWGLTTNYGNTAAIIVLHSALQFDGLDDALSIGWGKFPEITNNFTLELWAKPTASRAETSESISGSAGLGGQRYAIFPDHGAIAYGNENHVGAGVSLGTNGLSVIEHTSGLMPTVLVYTNNLLGWMHVALSYSNHLPRLYINGAFVRAGLVSSSIVHPSVNLGGTTNGYVIWPNYGQFQGALHDFRLWDVPLPSSTIQQWMNQPIGSNHPAFSHLQGYWPLSEGHGASAADSSARANSGQLLNGTFWTGGRETTSRTFAASIGGLTPGTTYHFRAVGTNSGGTVFGADQAFTTLSLPQVLDFRAHPDFSYLLRFTGAPSSTFTVEASTNLFNWTPLSNLPPGLFEFLDTGASNWPTRFYRIRAQ